MEQNSYNNLGFRIKTISQATREAITYIKERKEHSIESLKTRWPKFNKFCMGGIEPNTVYTIAGMSGSGKSAMANLIETDLFDQNPGKDIIVLSFTLEMSSSRQIGRKFSNKLRKTTSELYSANEDLDDESFNKILGISKSLSKYNIYYVDDPGTPEEVSRFIFNFYNEYVKDKHQYFVIIYDHALLTGKSGTTLDTISDLQKEFIKVKKLPLTTVIELSQLNRNIEASERINNPQNQFPIRSDLSSSDAIYQSCDYVLVVHRPELLGLTTYGPNRWPVSNKIYVHIIKNRDGKPVILDFDNELRYNNMKESVTESTNN